MSLTPGRYYISDKLAKKWSFVKDGSEVVGSYISFEELQKKHPDGKYTVVGEVLEKHDVTQRQTRTIETGAGEALPVNPVGMYSTKSYTNIGYILCGESAYIGFYKKSAKKFLLPLILVPLIVLFLLLGLWYLGGNKAEGDAMSGKLEIDSSITDYDGGLKAPANMDQTQIVIPGFSKLYLKEGGDTVNTVLYNPENNPCFFQFNIVNKADGQVLYESKLVPPGKGINGFQLNRTFSAGEYPAVIQFRTHDLEDPTINYNGSDMEITIVVIE